MRAAIIVAFLASSAFAADPDPWMQLGAVDRSNAYVFYLRGGRCQEAYIAKVDPASIGVYTDPPPTPKNPPAPMTIPRADVLRVGSGPRVHNVLYSGRSSWADAQASEPSAREHLVVALKSGATEEAESITVGDSDVTLQNRGKASTVAKGDVSRITYVRFKPLPASYQWVRQEAAWLLVFSPKTWQYGLKIHATMPVLLYDSAVPEDASPLACPPR